MKEETKGYLGIGISIGMFIFVGIAVQLNIYDAMTGNSTANIVNTIGWCLVPVACVICFIVYIKSIKNLTLR